MLTNPRNASLLRLPAKVTIAGAKNREFPATLAEIDPLPYHDYIQSIKVFNSEVHIDEVSPDLRPGYTCKVEIIVSQYDSVVSVPIQSVQLVRGRPTVFVKTPSGPQPRAVKTGMDNNRFIHIKSGLKAGEHVLLAPPFDEVDTKQSGVNRGKPKPKAKPAAEPAAATSRPSSGRRRTSSAGRGSGGGRHRR
jgi:hypothetical protein